MPEETSPDGGAQKLGMPLAIVIAGGFIAVALYFGGGAAPAAAPLEQNNPTTAQPDVVPVTAADHIFGNPSALIKIIEYTDLECPFCKRFHDTMKQVVAESNGNVAWIMRNFPLTQLHPNAPALAEAAECVASVAGNDAYWKFLDEMFIVAPLNTPFPMDKLDTTISKVATLAPVKACISAGTHKEKIQKEASDAVASGGNGTPHNILLDKKGNPTLISGAQPYEVVKAAVEAALKR